MNRQFDSVGVDTTDGTLTIYVGRQSMANAVFNAQLKIENGEATISGEKDRWKLNFMGTMDDCDPEEIQDEFVKWTRPWFGKPKKKILEGWVLLKGREKVSYTSNRYCVIENE